VTTNDHGESGVTPTETKTTRTAGNSPHGSRDALRTSASLEADRSKKARSCNAGMHVLGESDSSVVPGKPANNDSVTLTPARRLDLHRRYELVVNGSTPTGVADVARNLLDGDGNGQPGGNYVVVLRGFGRDEPERFLRKLISDQLGGMPISTRRISLRPASRALHRTLASPAHSAPRHSLRDKQAPVPHGPRSPRRTARVPIRRVKIAHNTLP
jgi:hypothetical protein